MKSSRAKRQRLMIPSYIPPLRPDVPARFESLSDDPLTTVLEFVGDKSYRSFGSVNKHCKEVYLNTPGMTKETFLFGYGPLSVIQDKIERAIFDDDDEEEEELELFKRVGKGVVFYNRKDVLKWALEEQKELVLNNICEIAGEEGRIDLLDEVWKNIYDEGAKEYVFHYVDGHAALHGKLNVLKWLEDKGVYINKENCAREAVNRGQLHILQWLREEKGLQLDGYLYIHAIWNDQLHVLKWFREKEVDWSVYIFRHAAKKGNLDILQWLHDEGCPWPNDHRYRVREEGLKPEVVEWLRANGYSDRFL